MLWRHDGTAEALRSPLPWLVLSGCLTLVAFGWNGLDRTRRQEASHEFDLRSEAVATALRTRMAAQEQLVRDSAAFVQATPNLTRDQFHDYAANLRLPQRHPAIQALAWARRTVSPTGSEAVVVTFVEPQAGRNLRAVGFDLHSEPTRRAAMDRAAERMDATLSGRVALAAATPDDAEAPQASAIFFAPITGRNGGPGPGSRGEIAGFVATPLRMDDLVRGAVDEPALEMLDLDIHDGAERNEATLLADTRHVFHAKASNGPPAFSRVLRMQLPGRIWTLHFTSRPAFEALMGPGRPWVVVAVGSIASLVVFLLSLAVMAAWIRTHQMSMRDPLTGLFNRRYVEETMGRELTRAKRRGESIGIVVLDLDHFKVLNDTHGHNAGDKVLVRVGELLRENTRGSDIPCRFGGEEFAVILPGATLEIARERAEIIREGLARMDIQFGGVHLGTCTLSAGVSALRPADTDWAYVLLQADRALYAAKQAGRNRVIAAAE